MMKKIVLTLWAVAALATVLHGEGRERERGSNPGRSSAAVSTSAPANSSILFVGVKDYNVSSNYYTKDQIADHFNVPESEVEEFFNETFYTVFNEAVAKKSLRLANCDETASQIVSHLDYDYQDGVLCSDLSGVDEAEYRNTLKQSGAQYLLVCDQYYVEKVGYPYDNFAHILHYSVFNASREKVYDGRFQYAALDLGNSDLLEKQLRKAADKFLKTIR